MSTTAAVVVALVVFLLEGNGRIAVSNVLILSVDTLRADRVGVYGGPGITPAMDELGQRGVVFEQSLTPAPLTLPAHASLLSGLYPMNHGLRDNGTYRLSDSTTLLGEIFRQAGYRTAAFVGAFALDSRFHLDQGFELYDDEFGLRPDGRPAIERRAEEVVRSALAWIDTIGGHEPFFSFVHFFDPHAPYGAPSPFGERFSGRPYEGEVAYVDHALGRLLTGLQERGRLESTIVVVTADHGEGLGEHGERTHGLFAYETTLRIPLIFAGPRIPRGKRVETRVRLVDVYPTLLELAGLDVPPGLDGASLRSLLDGGSGRAGEQRDSYFEALTFHFNRDGAPLYGLYHETYKLIQVPIPELYDLSVDPNEERNIAGAKPELLGRMRSELSRLGVERHLEAAKDTETAADVETLERLSALGYLVGASRCQPCSSLLRGGRPEAPPRCCG